MEQLDLVITAFIDFLPELASLKLWWQNFWVWLKSDWIYFSTLIPLIYALNFWLKKNSDESYLDKNVYVKTAQGKRLFDRPFLPSEYKLLDNFSSGQIGVIVDEELTLNHILAEILELARLGYLKVKKSKSPKLSQEIKYQLIKLKEIDYNLPDYQKHLFSSLFAGTAQVVNLSNLKDNLSNYWEGFRLRMYKSLLEAGVFPNLLNRIKESRLSSTMLVILASLPFVIFGGMIYGKLGMVLIIFPSSILSLVIVNSLPPKTDWGYYVQGRVEDLITNFDEVKKNDREFWAGILPFALGAGFVEEVLENIPHNLGQNLIDLKNSFLNDKTFSVEEHDKIKS